MLGLWLGFAPPASAQPGDPDLSWGKLGLSKLGKGSTGFGRGPGTAIAPSADGTYVVYQAGGESRLSRLDEDGQLDDSFGAGGVAALPEGLNPSLLSVTPEGQPLVGGGVDRLTYELVRFTRDGTLDPDYGVGGVATLKLQDGPYVLLAGAAADPQGRVVVMGQDASGISLTRISAGGEVDPSFSAPHLDLDIAFGVGVTAQGDGYLVADVHEIRRLAEDGSIDTSFGSGGKADLPPPFTFPQPTVLSVDASERIYVGQRAGADPGSKSFSPDSFHRLLPDGSPDPSFDAGPALSLIPWINDIAFGSDGRLFVAGGQVRGGYGFEHSVPAVARLEDDGSLDPSFGDGGAETFSPKGTGFAIARDAEIDPAGRLLAAGSGAVLRLLPGASSPDTDGDGYSDRRDACPLHKALRRGGCGPKPRRLVVRLVAGSDFTGQVVAPRRCLAGAGKHRAFVRVKFFVPGPESTERIEVGPHGVFRLTGPDRFQAYSFRFARRGAERDCGPFKVRRGY